MPQQIALQGDPTSSCNALTHCNPPQAPPGANRVQLELWRRILLQRSEQIQSLSPTTLQSYADAIAVDLKSSRFKKVSGQQRDVDLAKGHLSAHLLSHPLHASVAVQNVVHHIMALFFRSIDERLSSCERKYGLDAVKRALLSLDNALVERGNTQVAAGENQLTVHNSKTSRKEKDGAPISGDDSSRDKPAASEKAVVGDGANRPGHQKDASEQTQPGASSKEKRKANENGDIGGDDGATETASKRQRKEQQHPPEATANAKPKPSHNRESEIVLVDSDTEDESTEDRATNGNPSSTKASSSQTDSVQKKQTVTKEKKDANDGAAAESTVASATGKGLPCQPAPSKPTPAEKKPQPVAQKPAPRKAAADAKTALRALPPAISFSRVRHVAFVADNHTPYLASASLRPRNPCTLSYDAGFNANGSGACLDHNTFLGVRQRLETFDPFWKVIHELGIKQCPGGQGRTTKVATRTAACVSSVQLGNHPTSCAVVEVDLYTERNSSRFDLAWGKRNIMSYKTGDRRLILRMLPLKRTEKDEKKSADTHKWPIGTFIQVSRGATEQVLIVAQRRQQSHDPNLWKGLSHPLDLTTFLPDANVPFTLKICTKEAIERVASPKFKLGTNVSKEFEGDDGEMRPFSGTVKGFDPDYQLYRIIYEDGDAEELTETEVAAIVVKGLDITEEPKLLQGSYGIHLAVCEYIGADDLYSQLLKVLPTIPLEESRRMAKQYLVRQTVSIDSDDDEDDNLGDTSLNFSLLCPLSKTAIGTPVKGKHCKHIQCFDLKSFLHSNKSVSGGRWRCGCCEDFVSVKDLVRCGLFEAMLQDHREEVSGARHEVSFKSDGTWEMKGSEAGSRRGGSSSGAAGDGDAGDGAGEPRKQPEVIDLL